MNQKVYVTEICDYSCFFFYSVLYSPEASKIDKKDTKNNSNIYLTRCRRVTNLVMQKACLSYLLSPLERLGVAN